MTPHQRLDLARQRLMEALKAGEDTAPHRASIQQIEADLARQADAATAASADNDRQRQAAIEARALALTAEARDAIAREIETLDLEPQQ